MELVAKFKKIILFQNDYFETKKLNNSISEQEIIEIEKLIREPLPDEFKELYLFANGENEDENGLFFGEYFIDSHKIIEHLKFSLTLVKPEIKKIENKEKSDKIINEIISFYLNKAPKHKFFGIKKKWHKIEFSCSPNSVGGPYLYNDAQTEKREILKIGHQEYGSLYKIVNQLHELEKETYNWDELEFVLYANGNYECKRTFYDFDNEIDFTSTPENAIKKKYFNYKWIPLFSDGGGNYIGIDIDPDIQGKKGQIINFGRDEEDMFVLADNLEKFFDLILDEMSKSNNKLLNNETHLHEILKKLIDKNT